ncbi:DUF2867 domain-containing protein [Nocardioides sp. 1609]|uniref:DUF2867 domain-containing protein n=1 Tax=Nocardioides sp. 1609 TaxID=2508327 RepID=UPI001070601B|nr:DUF2867 domain-containing protein [Nocardioides sp. 1609]
MRRARTLHTSRRDATVRLTPDDAWSVVASGRAGRQWYVDAAPFVFRRWIDRLALGPGLRRPPPDRPLLAPGDRVGFWRVTGADHGARRLLLEADVRAPGTVRLEAAVGPDEDVEGASTVSVTVGFAPRGVLGRAYLLADLPAREAVTELALLDLLTILRRRDNPEGPGSVDQV